MKACRVRICICAALVLSAQRAHARDERSVETSGPQYSLYVQPAQAPQGGVVVVRAQPLGEFQMTALSGALGSLHVKGSPWARGEQIMIVPIGILHHLGPAQLKLKIEDAQGHIYNAE